MSNSVFEGDQLEEIIEMIRQGVTSKMIAVNFNLSTNYFSNKLNRTAKKFGFNVDMIRAEKYRIIWDKIDALTNQGYILTEAAKIVGYSITTLRVWITDGYMTQKDTDFAKHVIAKARANYFVQRFGCSRKQIEDKGLPFEHIPDNVLPQKMTTAPIR